MTVSLPTDPKRTALRYTLAAYSNQTFIEAARAWREARVSTVFHGGFIPGPWQITQATWVATEDLSRSTRPWMSSKYQPEVYADWNKACHTNIGGDFETANLTKFRKKIIVIRKNLANRMSSLLQSAAGQKTANFPAVPRPVLWVDWWSNATFVRAERWL